MPFTVSGDEIRLKDPCPVDEAEALYDALRALANPVFDLSEAGHLHTAVVQLILATGGQVRGVPDDLVLRACLRPQNAA
jgi:hypothetical protein